MSGGFRLLLAGQSRIVRDIRAGAAPGFGAVRGLVRGADLAFTNLETAIRGRHGGYPMKDGYRPPPGPEVLDALSWAGFRALSLANNHAFDLGPGGILSTLEETEARGFLHAGIGADAAGAAKAGFIEVAGRRVALLAMDASPQPDCFYAADAAGDLPARPGIARLAVRQSLRLPEEDYARLRALSADLGHERRMERKYSVGFGKRPAGAAVEGAFDFYGTTVERGERLEEGRSVEAASREAWLSAIREAAMSADLVIVYLHHHLWQPDWESVPEWTRGFARACVEAGAGVFVSHGVPVLQGLEIHLGKPIFHSLGNFIFHSHREATRRDEALWKSLLATCEFDAEGRLSGIDFAPIVLGGEAALQDPGLGRELPELATGGLARGILDGFAGLSSALGTRVELVGGRGRWSLR